jgi:hypothetical protein
LEEVIALVTSVDPLAPCKAFADPILELVNVTATIEEFGRCGRKHVLG